MAGGFPAAMGGSASGTVAARYSVCGSSEIVPARSGRFMACRRALAPVASAWPSAPHPPSQNGAQAANGRKTANRLSLTLAALRFARSDIGCMSLPQRPCPPRRLNCMIIPFARPISKKNRRCLGGGRPWHRPNSRNPRCRWRETYTIYGCSGQLLLTEACEQRGTSRDAPVTYIRSE